MVCVSGVVGQKRIEVVFGGLDVGGGQGVLGFEFVDFLCDGGEAVGGDAAFEGVEDAAGVGVRAALEFGGG